MQNSKLPKRQQLKFEVLGMRFEQPNFKKLSNHVRDERLNRLKMAKGWHEKVDAFIVDTGHKNGLEIHYIMKNASVVMVNLRTGKLITVIQARPQQIKRYYLQTGLSWEQNVINHARNNVAEGRNSL